MRLSSVRTMTAQAVISTLGRCSPVPPCSSTRLQASPSSTRFVVIMLSRTIPTPRGPRCPDIPKFRHPESGSPECRVRRDFIFRSIPILQLGLGIPAHGTSANTARTSSSTIGQKSIDLNQSISFFSRFDHAPHHHPSPVHQTAWRASILRQPSMVTAD